jgi:thioredoxin-like negative regulator of GroEL
MLAPVYAAAAKELKARNLTLGKVDATVEGSLAKEYMITGFPTVILFHKGEKVEEYNGDRSTDGA